MAWVALAGLAVNATWGKSWADPLAALALTPLIFTRRVESLPLIEIVLRLRLAL
jgi:hypothetical protein